MTDLTPPTRAQIHPELVDRAPTQVVCHCVDVHPQTYDHQVQMVNPFGKTRLIVCIDVCLATSIAELWHQGVETTNSCCGHGDMEPSVCVTEASFPKMVELGWRQDPDVEFVWYPPAAESVRPCCEHCWFEGQYICSWGLRFGRDKHDQPCPNCLAGLGTCGATQAHEAHMFVRFMAGGNPGPVPSKTHWCLGVEAAPAVPGEPEVEALVDLTRIVLRQRLLNRNLPVEGRGYMEDERALSACEPVARAVLAAGYLSPSQVRARERAAWAAGRETGAAFEQARWTGAGVIGVPRPEVPVKNPFGGDA